MAVDVNKLWLKQFMDNVDYRVDLTHAYFPGETLFCYLTSPVILTTRSDWGPMATQPFADKSGIAQMTVGKSSLVWLATEQAWTGTQPISFSLSVAFIALENAFDEVVEPSRTLLKYPLPPDITDPIKPPAKVKEGIGCSIFIGTNIYIPETDLYPVDAQVTFSMVKDKTGNPIRSDAVVSFVTQRAMSADDIDVWFG